jgi:hypothetical protein
MKGEQVTDAARLLASRSEESSELGKLKADFRTRAVGALDRQQAEYLRDRSWPSAVKVLETAMEDPHVLELLDQAELEKLRKMIASAKTVWGRALYEELRKGRRLEEVDRYLESRADPAMSAYARKYREYLVKHAGQLALTIKVAKIEWFDWWDNYKNKVAVWLDEDERLVFEDDVISHENGTSIKVGEKGEKTVRRKLTEQVELRINVWNACLTGSVGAWAIIARPGTTKPIDGERGNLFARWLSKKPDKDKGKAADKSPRERSADDVARDRKKDDDDAEKKLGELAGMLGKGFTASSTRGALEAAIERTSPAPGPEKGDKVLPGAPKLDDILTGLLKAWKDGGQDKFFLPGLAEEDRKVVLRSFPPDKPLTVKMVTDRRKQFDRLARQLDDFAVAAQGLDAVEIKYPVRPKRRAQCEAFVKLAKRIREEGSTKSGNKLPRLFEEAPLFDLRHAQVARLLAAMKGKGSGPIQDLCEKMELSKPRDAIKQASDALLDANNDPDIEKKIEIIRDRLISLIEQMDH